MQTTGTGYVNGLQDPSVWYTPGCGFLIRINLDNGVIHDNKLLWVSNFSEENTEQSPAYNPAIQNLC